MIGIILAACLFCWSFNTGNHSIPFCNLTCCIHFMDMCRMFRCATNVLKELNYSAMDAMKAFVQVVTRSMIILMRVIKNRGGVWTMAFFAKIAP